MMVELNFIIVIIIIIIIIIIIYNSLCYKIQPVTHVEFNAMPSSPFHV